MPYDWNNEDSGAYEPQWVPVPSNISTEDLDPTPWTYQEQLKLKGTPYWAQFATYWGGGEWLIVKSRALSHSPNFSVR